MAQKKDRRKSGRVIVSSKDPVNFPGEYTYWNEWNYHRDCDRGYGDNSKIRSTQMPHAEAFEVKKYNKKNKKLLKIRKERKEKWQ